jgi:hypothetical protein
MKQFILRIPDELYNNIASALGKHIYKTKNQISRNEWIIMALEKACKESEKK